MNHFAESLLTFGRGAKLLGRFCKILIISMLISYWSCWGVLAVEASSGEGVSDMAELLGAFRLESWEFPPAAEKVEAASAVYRVFKADEVAAIKAIDAMDAGGHMRTYGDWFFSQKQFGRASFYYKLSLLTQCDSGIDSRDWGSSKHAKYRLGLIEENRDDCQGKPLEMYAEVFRIWGAEFREKMNRIKVLYPKSLILDDVDYALSKGMDNDLELASHWQQFLRDHPQSPLCSKVESRLTMAYDNLGAKSRHAGRYEEAEKWYAIFLERPMVIGGYKYHGSYINAGYFFEERGKLDIAEQAYKKGIDCGSWHSAYNALGFFYERQYDLDKYIDYLRERGQSQWEIERRLSDMGVEKWCQSFGAFPKGYDLCGSDEFDFNGVHFVGQLHKRKKEVAEEFPQYVLRLGGHGDKLLLRIDSDLFKLGFTRGSWYKVVNAGAMVLCVSYPSGGNALNANPCYVVSLEKETNLKLLGRVGYVKDFDGDGEDDLGWYEDVWESGLGSGWFGHSAGMNHLSPRIYYHIVKGKLVAYQEKNIRYWRDEIRELDEQIEKYRGQIPKDAQSIMEPEGSWLLLKVLSKFLRYRMLGESQKGMEELGRDLRYCDEEYFYFRRWAKGGKGKVIGKYPAGEIEQIVKKSLERYPVPRTSKRSIWAYVTPP